MTARSASRPAEVKPTMVLRSSSPSSLSRAGDIRVSYSGSPRRRSGREQDRIHGDLERRNARGHREDRVRAPECRAPPRAGTTGRRGRTHRRGGLAYPSARSARASLAGGSGASHGKEHRPPSRRPSRPLCPIRRWGDRRLSRWACLAFPGLRGGRRVSRPRRLPSRGPTTTHRAPG